MQRYILSHQIHKSREMGLFRMVFVWCFHKKPSGLGSRCNLQTSFCSLCLGSHKPFVTQNTGWLLFHTFLCWAGVFFCCGHGGPDSSTPPCVERRAWHLECFTAEKGNFGNILQLSGNMVWLSHKEKTIEDWLWLGAIVWDKSLQRCTVSRIKRGMFRTWQVVAVPVAR